MITGFIAIAFTFFSFNPCDTTVNREHLTGYDYRLYQGTPAWTLAKAVKSQDTALIVNIITKNHDLLEYQDPKFGATLLNIAVMTLKYNSVKTLVSLGADPNRQDKYAGSSPLMSAADILLNDDYSYGSNPKYLRLLLDHGGDPNAEQRGDRPQGYNIRLTPLLNACGTGYLDYVKLLVEYGANVKYNNNGMNPLSRAVLSPQPTAVVMYLIEKGADYKLPVLDFGGGEKIYITKIMRDWRFDLGSEEYKRKMQLADFLKKNGMDYWKEPIPKRYLKQYPKDYLDKY